MPTAHGPLSEIPERASHQACSAASTERVEAILDTGASRCVIGDRLLEQFLHQMPKSTRAQVRESPSAVKFRFGNNGTLTSTKRVYLPVQSTCGKMLWMGVEVVPGQTPFLFSKRVLKQLDGTLCTRSDTCWLGRLGIQLDLSTNISGLYLIDVAKLCTSVKKPAASVQLSASADAHVIQGSPNTEYEDSKTIQPYVGNSSVLSESPRTPAVHVNDTKPSTGDTISCSVIPATQETCQRANMLLSEACRSSPRQRSRSPEPLPCDHAPLRGSRCDSEPAQDGCHSHSVAPSGPHADRDRIHGAARERCRTPDFGHPTACGRNESPGRGVESPCREAWKCPASRSSLQERGWRPTYRGHPDDNKFKLVWKGQSGSCRGHTASLEAPSVWPSADCATDASSWRPSGGLGPKTSAQHLSQGVRDGSELRGLDAGSRMGPDEQPTGFPEVLPLQVPSRGSLRVNLAQESEMNEEVSLKDLKDRHLEMMNLLESTQQEVDQVLREHQTFMAKDSSNTSGSEATSMSSHGETATVEANGQDSLAAGNPVGSLQVSLAPDCQSSSCSNPFGQPKICSLLLGKSLRRRMFQTSRVLQKKQSYVSGEVEQAVQTLNKTQVDAAFSSHSRHPSDKKGIDLLEVFAYPNSRLTEAVQDMGGQARRVTREDCDLATPAGQRYLMNLVYELKPEHIFVAPECKLWGNWSRFNMSRGPAQWDAISRPRLAQGTILHLCSRLCQIQIDAGRHFHLEQPAGSSMLDQEALRPVIRATCPVLVDMCRFNLRLPGSSKLIRKRTVIRSTSSLMVECLDGMMCRKNHAHQQVAGSARVGGRTLQVSHFAASYSRGFAMAVAQVLLKESHAALAFAFPALEPPRTRKRFKTTVGAPPVPVNNPVDRKRGLPEEARASKKSRVPVLPHLEIPQVFDAELWQSIPQELSSCAVRLGTCSIDNANRVFLRIQNLLPKVSIARMFSTRHARQLQMPIGAPPPSESPWRLSLGWSSVDDTPQVCWLLNGAET